jgi:hypothetical protein
MTSEISVFERVGEIGFAFWIFGYLAKDVLKILGEVFVDGIRLVKTLKKQLRGSDDVQKGPQHKCEDADDA